MASPSRINITMLDALCSSCNTIKPLNACFHCMQPLCSDCINKHVDLWREASLNYCDLTNKKIENYSSKICALDPLIAQNKTNIDQVKTQIENSFQEFIIKLTSQKDELFKKIDQIENENQEFISFQTDIIGLKENLVKLQELLKNNENKENFLSQYNNFQDCKEQVQSLVAKYSNLKTKPFKIIGEYEKSQTKDGIEVNFFGNLIINESELLKSDADSIKKEKIKHTKQSNNETNLKKENDNKDKIQMFGTLRVKLRRLAEQMNELQPKIKLPLIEYDLTIKPKFITNNSKLIFIADEDGNLMITELNKTLIIKSIQKLCIMNVCCISANKNYLAVSFSDLNSEQISSVEKMIRKSFNLKSGVLLFKLNDSFSNLTVEKIFSSDKNYNLLTPVGIAINESHLFVCDKELHALFKIELKTGNLIQRLITTNEEPTSICLGEKYFVYTDALKLELNLVDMEKFTILKTVKFSDDLFNEPFDLAYKEKSYIFVKNRADTRLILYDSKLNIKYSFEYENSNSQGINFINFNNKEFLLLGNTKLENKKFKLGIFTDF